MVWLSRILVVALLALGGAVDAGAAEPSRPENDKILDAYPTPESRVTPHPLQEAFKAAEAGNLFAQRYLARTLEHTREAWRVLDEPAIWYRRAAERGAAFDIRELACFTYRNDENRPRRQKAATEGMKKAADAGDIWAAIYYSRFARYGYGMAADTAEADKYLALAVAALRKQTERTFESEIWDELRERQCGPDDEKTADKILSAKK